jgi:hypothetical protein
MPLTTGTRLGSYEISAALGAGGMGEVYRARDTKLNRDVAVKVLPEAFAADPERLARFEREAQVLAALNHPNIAHVYGLEKRERQDRHDTSAFIVMELVDGEELAQRIARGPMPLDEALPIATQIAEALEAAHEQGIVHRDLKPANVKIKTDGTVKILDFGLAKAIDSAVSTVSATMSPTLSIHATQAGIILGTAAYMSPEQARGKPVDKRADIWSFGAVLYEMVTGRKPFRGDEVSDVLASILKDEPRWDLVPHRLRPLLKRCLEKDPRKRLRDVSGVGLLLEEPSLAATRAHTSRLPWVATGALAVVAAMALWAPWRRTSPELRPLVRLDVDLGSDVLLGSPQGADVIVSPDGNRLAWVSRGRLFTRRLDQSKALELAGTLGAASPFFSPDGRWLAFFAAGRLRKVSVEGGASITLCDAPQGRGGGWSEDGRIVASLDGNLLATISDAGGAPTPLMPLAQGEAQHRWPHVLPGSRAMIFTARPTSSTSWDDATIEVLRVPDGRRKTLQRGGSFGRYVAASNGDGYLLYVTKGTLFAVPFDVGRLEVRGTPLPIVEDVGYNGANGAAQFDLSRAGTLVYRRALSGAVVSLQWLDAIGNLQALPTKPAVYLQPRLSPDGRLLAMAITSGDGTDIWVYEWQRDVMSRLTFGGGNYGYPVWSPDGRFLVFFAGGLGGLYWIRADGASAPQQLTRSQNPQFPWSFSPDGKRLAFAEFPMSGGDIWTVPVEDDGGMLKAGKPEPFLQTPASELYPAFSPDGRWIAYRTFESGTSEIQVRAFPDKGGKWLISNGGGVVPVWSPNGRELFYRSEDQHIMVVSYTVKDDAFVPDKPRRWSDRILAESPARNLDIAPDGRRFVTMMPVDTPAEPRMQSQVVFLQNFADELRRRAPSAAR